MMCHYDARVSQRWPSEKLPELTFLLSDGSEAPQNTGDVAPCLTSLQSGRRGVCFKVAILNSI